MVLAMTLHPRMERVVFVSDFRLGGENQILQFKESVSGRGIRIGKAVQELGEKVECMGFCSAGVRHALYEELIQAGIASDFIETAIWQKWAKGMLWPLGEAFLRACGRRFMLPSSAWPRREKSERCSRPGENAFCRALQRALTPHSSPFWIWKLPQKKN